MSFCVSTLLKFYFVPVIGVSWVCFIEVKKLFILSIDEGSEAENINLFLQKKMSTTISLKITQA